MNKYKKFIYLLIIAITIVGTGIRVFAGHSNNTESNDISQSISLLAINEYRNETKIVETVGTVQSENQITLRSEVSTKVSNILVRPGSQVNIGELLLTFENNDAELQAEQALAGLRGAQAQLRALIAEPSYEDIERAELAISQAEIGLSIAQSDLERVKLNNEQLIRNINQAVDNLYNSSLTSAITAESTLRNSLAIIADNELNYPGCFNPELCDKLRSRKREVIFHVYNIPNAGNWGGTAIRNLNSGIRAELAELQNNLDGQKLRNGLEILETGLTISVEIIELQKTIFDPIFGANQISPTDRANLDNLSLNINNQLQVIQGRLQAFDEVEGGIIGGQPRRVEEARVSAEQNLRIARLGLENADIALKNAENALAQLLTGPREVDIDPIRAQVDSARINYALAQNQLNKFSIIAPFSGEIGNLQAQIGDIITPGQAILTLTNPSALEVKINLSPAEARKIGRHSEVLVDGRLNGVITYIGSAIDSQTGNIEIGVAILDNSDLMIGEFVKVQFTSNKENEEFYTLPLSAVRAESRGYSVLIIEDGQARKVAVEVNNIIGNSIEVSFVEEKPEFIIESIRGIKEGDKVEIN